MRKLRWIIGGSERGWTQALTGLHLATAYVYGLLHWPFATALVAALYFMIVLHRLPEDGV